MVLREGASAWSDPNMLVAWPGGVETWALNLVLSFHELVRDQRRYLGIISNFTGLPLEVSSVVTAVERHLRRTEMAAQHFTVT